MSCKCQKNKFYAFATKSINSPNITITLNGLTVERVRHCKFLGVIVYDKLSWIQNIKHITSKISKGVRILKRSSKNLNPESLIILYNSLVLPYFNYGNMVWAQRIKLDWKN